MENFDSTSGYRFRSHEKYANSYGSISSNWNFNRWFLLNKNVTSYHNKYFASYWTKNSLHNYSKISLQAANFLYRSHHKLTINHTTNLIQIKNRLHITDFASYRTNNNLQIWSFTKYFSFCFRSRSKLSLYRAKNSRDRTPYLPPPTID